MQNRLSGGTFLLYENIHLFMPSRPVSYKYIAHCERDVRFSNLEIDLL